MGLLSTAAKAAVASSVHGRVQRRQQMRWAHQDAHAVHQGAAPPDPFSMTDLKATFTSPHAGAAAAAPTAAPAETAATAAASAPVTDMQAQLALIGQLNDLRTAGALSDEELKAKKAQILAL